MMKTTRSRSRLATFGFAALLTLPTLTVDFAHANAEDEKAGLRGRLTVVSDKVTGGVGSGLSTAKNQVVTVGSKVGEGVTSGLTTAKNGLTTVGSKVTGGVSTGLTSVKSVGSRFAGSVSTRFRSVKTRVTEVGTQATDLATHMHGRASDVTTTLTSHCVELLTSTTETLEDTLVHTSDPWDLGPEIEGTIAKIWSEAPSEEVAMRQHLRVIFEARVVNAATKVNFSTVAETRAFQNTVGRWWSPEPVDYSDFLHDVIDPRFNPESLNASEMFKLARELGQDFNERFDAIRSSLNSVVRFANDTWIPLPSHIAVKVLHIVLGPVLDHKNENARIGALWEVARLLPSEVRDHSITKVESFIKEQDVPEWERARFRRFVFSAEFERVARLVEQLQMAGVLFNKSIGTEQILVRTGDIDSPKTTKVRDDLRKMIKPSNELYPRVLEVIGEDGVAALERVFNLSEEYLALDNGGPLPEHPEIREKQLERIIRRYQWSKLKKEERDGIEIALASLKNAHLPKDEFIAALTDIHDNDFSRVVLKTFLPDFLTKRAPRDRAE